MGTVLGSDAGTEGVFPVIGPVNAHQLGTRGLAVEFARSGIDRVLDQADFPFEAGIDDRALDQPLAARSLLDPFEAAFAVGIAQQGEVVAPGRCGGARSQQCRIGIGRAVAVLAADLDRIGDLSVDKPVAVAVLGEVAIGALQSLLGVNVHHVDRLARILAHFDELRFALAPPFLGIIGVDDIAFGVEQVAFAIAFQDGAEIPAMAMIIGELRVLELGIEIVDIAQEIDIAP